VNDVARVLVFPKSEKDRVTKTIITSPFRKFDLANNRRLNPTATLHLRSGQSLVPTTSTSGGTSEKGTEAFFVKLTKYKCRLKPSPDRKMNQGVQKALLPAKIPGTVFPAAGVAGYFAIAEVKGAMRIAARAARGIISNYVSLIERCQKLFSLSEGLFEDGVRRASLRE
jgi:hypothetical protein